MQGKSGGFWLLTLVAGVALVLAVLNMALDQSNQAVQAEINNSQEYINQTLQISRLNTQVIQALANLSARTGDEQISNLLAAHGISFSTNSTGSHEKAGRIENNKSE
jgi:hypothetical protein